MSFEELLAKAIDFRKVLPNMELDVRHIMTAELGGEKCYLHLLEQPDGVPVLVVYPGESGEKSLIRVLQSASDEIEGLAAALAQSALHVSYVMKNDLSREEQDSLRFFAKSTGRSIRGKFAWPQFHVFTPFRQYKPVKSEKDMLILADALDLMVWLSEHMISEKILIPAYSPGAEELPFFRREGEDYAILSVPMPEIPEVSYPEGVCNNDVYLARLKKLRKEGQWACRVVPVTRLGLAEGMDEPVYPWNLLTVDEDEDEPIEVTPVRDYETRTDVMLNKFMEAIFDLGVCPEAIAVHDERTEALLQKWCDKAGVELIWEESEALDELADMQDIEDLLDDPDQMEDVANLMMNFMISAPDEVLRDYANQVGDLDQLAVMFANITEFPDAPEPIKKRAQMASGRIEEFLSKEAMRKEKKKAQKGKKRNSGTDGSFVISVSLGTGCYRHLRISGDDTLYDLSSAILTAFDFDDDHCHEFYLDNLLFSPEDCYHHPDLDEDGSASSEVTLADAGLHPGQKFKYLFDFGDHWVFQCRVLKELNEPTAGAIVMRSVGDAPAQYPE